MKQDVCLVNMPYTSLSMPSLALGLIESYIKPYGHKIHTEYANLNFAQIVGVEIYEFINSSNNEFLLGEWTFSRIAFPELEHDDNQFFDLFSDITDDIKQTLLTLRRKAEAYVESLADKLLMFEPKIVGCSSTFQQNCASLALLRLIKTKSPQTVTVLGGANCEGVMGKTISENFNWVDFVFSGECDQVIGEFFDNIIQDKIVDARYIPEGVITQKFFNLLGNNSVTAPRAYVENMGIVKSPVFDSYFSTLNALEISNVISPGLVAETSRGCWWGAKKHCTFCGLNGGSMEHRSKPAEVALEELFELSEKYQVNKFLIADNILPSEYMKTFVPSLAAKENKLSLFFETKANLRKEHLQSFAAAGIKWIQPGLEGLHDEFLKAIHKGTSAAQNVATLKWCRTFGIRVTWNFLFGIPYEEAIWYEEMKQLIPLITHLPPPAFEMVRVRYHRFSPYFNDSKKYNLDLEPVKSYGYIYPLNEKKLSDIAYFFEEKKDCYKGMYSLNGDFEGIFEEHKLLQEEVDKWSELWGSGQAPMLYMVDSGESTIIFDTRPIAVTSLHSLSSFEAEIYKICEEPTSFHRVWAKISKTIHKHSQQDLKKALTKLIDAKILVNLSNCYLSLACPAGDYEMLPLSDMPAGYVYS